MRILIQLQAIGTKRAPMPSTNARHQCPSTLPKGKYLYILSLKIAEWSAWKSAAAKSLRKFLMDPTKWGGGGGGGFRKTPEG